MIIAACSTQCFFSFFFSPCVTIGHSSLSPASLSTAGHKQQRLTPNFRNPFPWLFFSETLFDERKTVKQEILSAQIQDQRFPSDAHPFCLVLQKLCSSCVKMTFFISMYLYRPNFFIHRSIVLVQVSFVFWCTYHLSVSSAEGLEVYLI